MFEDDPSINNDELNKIASNFQNENYKRQIELLSEKLSMKESEYTSQINNLISQLNFLKDTEIKLRTSLSERDKAITEFNQLIKEYQTELINLKKLLCEKDQKLSEMSLKFNSIKSNCNTISAALNSREETNKNIEHNLTKAINDKNKIGNKLEELVSIANEYKKQLDIMNSKCLSLERENNNLKYDNNNLSNENKKFFNHNNKYLSEITGYKNNINEFEKVTKEYNEQVTKLQNEVDNLNKKLTDNKNQINALLEENSKLNTIVNEIKNKKNIIEKELSNNIKLNKKNNEIIAQYEIDMKTIVKFCNENIKNINLWIDNYLGSDIPNNNNFNNFCENNDCSCDCNLSNTKDNNLNKRLSMKSSQKTINSVYDNMNSNNNNIDFEQIKQKLYALKNKLNTESSIAQKYNNETNDKLNKYLEILNIIYNNILNEVNAHQYFIYDNIINNCSDPNENDECVNMLNIINILINKLLQYLLDVSNENNYLRNDISNYKTKIIELQKMNQDLLNENKDYKAKTYDNKHLNNDFNKCAQMNKILEKKIKNSETELELKQMQINSLEEIIKRRGENNNGFVNEENKTQQNEKIKKLEEDRVKLIKDNMKLIQYNKKLKEQINNLNSIINNISSNNNFNSIENNNSDIKDNDINNVNREVDIDKLIENNEENQE